MKKLFFLLPLLLLTGCATVTDNTTPTPVMDAYQKGLMEIAAAETQLDNEVQSQRINIPFKDTGFQSGGDLSKNEAQWWCTENCNQNVSLKEAVQLIIDSEGLKYVGGSSVPAHLVK